MSTLIRWEPAREMVTLREAMDRLFDDAFTRPLGMAGFQTPAIDMYQTDEEIVVKASLPGMKADAIKIVLIDHGEPFDPASIPMPDLKADLSERKIGGLGIFLMRKLMDEVRYESHPETNSNTLTMIKHKR